MRRLNFPPQWLRCILKLLERRLRPGAFVLRSWPSSRRAGGRRSARWDCFGTDILYALRLAEPFLIS